MRTGVPHPRGHPQPRKRARAGAHVGRHVLPGDQFGMSPRIVEGLLRRTARGAGIRITIVQGKLLARMSMSFAERLVSRKWRVVRRDSPVRIVHAEEVLALRHAEIGRASCRESV